MPVLGGVHYDLSGSCPYNYLIQSEIYIVIVFTLVYKNSKTRHGTNISRDEMKNGFIVVIFRLL